MAQYRRRSTRPREPKIFKPKVIWSPDMMMWAVKTSFSPEVGTADEYRTELKLMCDIPPKFDPDIKAWLVDERDEKIVRELLQKYWPSYGLDWETKPAGQSFGRNYDPTADDSSFRKLFILAGRDNANKFWRSALSIHHPDTGGDSTKATEVNVAWTEIKRQLGW